MSGVRDRAADWRSLAVEAAAKFAPPLKANVCDCAAGQAEAITDTHRIDCPVRVNGMPLSELRPRVMSLGYQFIETCHAMGIEAWGLDVVRGHAKRLRSAYDLVCRLRHGGRIVSTADLTPEQIEAARADGRMWVDDDFLGYVYLPPESVS